MRKALAAARRRSAGSAPGCSTQSRCPPSRVGTPVAVAARAWAARTGSTQWRSLPMPRAHGRGARSSPVARRGRQPTRRRPPDFLFFLFFRRRAVARHRRTPRPPCRVAPGSAWRSQACPLQPTTRSTPWAQPAQAAAAAPPACRHQPAACRPPPARCVTPAAAPRRGCTLPRPWPQPRTPRLAALASSSGRCAASLEGAPGARTQRSHPLHAA
mmetsp:Transcript_11408/g.29088  ORF Transcript_11408/g.29088 Transcript_11408/m.29088 type:complete len:214 (-) Transcript_11408:267-908(-)